MQICKGFLVARAVQWKSARLMGGMGGRTCGWPVSKRRQTAGNQTSETLALTLGQSVLAARVVLVEVSGGMQGALAAERGVRDL